MDITLYQEEQKRPGIFCYQDGRLYFTRLFERRIFFAGTIIMLAWGLLVKIGIM